MDITLLIHDASYDTKKPVELIDESVFSKFLLPPSDFLRSQKMALVLFLQVFEVADIGSKTNYPLQRTLKQK